MTFVIRSAPAFCAANLATEHGFGNVTDEPASPLMLFTPGAPREFYFFPEPPDNKDAYP